MFALKRSDKIAGFAQGFIPAIISHEILIRKQVTSGERWLNFFIIIYRSWGLLPPSYPGSTT